MPNDIILELINIQFGNDWVLQNRNLLCVVPQILSILGWCLNSNIQQSQV